MFLLGGREVDLYVEVEDLPTPIHAIGGIYPVGAIACAVHGILG